MNPVNAPAKFIIIYSSRAMFLT